MRRSTAVEQFENVIKALRNACPEIRLATQVIIEFPTEAEQEVQDTISTLPEFFRFGINNTAISIHAFIVTTEI